MSRRLGRDITASMSNSNTMLPPTQDDPFVSTPPHAHPSPQKSDENKPPSNEAVQQTRKALERYISDTDKRIQEASTLGTSLLQSRKKLVSQLQNFSQIESADKIGPELQSKLIDIEREHAALSKETARAFNNPPRLDPTAGGDTPMSPVVYSADTRASPSKIAAPSRRQRNQPSSRVHDIEFATEISTSLLAQVRQLQTALAQKDDLLKTESSQRTKLEMDLIALRQRMRIHDENEQKFKDENWSLETQLQDANATLKHLKDNESRLTQNLRKADQANDDHLKTIHDMRLSREKLDTDQLATKRQHDSDLQDLKRDIADYDAECQQLNDRVTELTARNDDLVKVVALKSQQAQRFDHASASAAPVRPADHDDTSNYSPPASPSKNARSGMLETETLKSSLQHAHRMIQTLKNNIHREKTDKLELKRMLQDARDEMARQGGSTDNAKKRRSETDSKRKLVRADQLGATRHSREDIIMDDPEWEDHDGVDPTRTFSIGSVRPSSAVHPQSYTAADEISDAFETANERDATETEAFATGDYHLSDDEGESTETETPIKHKPSTGSIGVMRANSSASFQSTASASDTEAGDVKTPDVAPFQNQKYKLKLGHRGRRFDRHGKMFENVTPSAMDSPAASITSSTRSTPVAGKTLGDELDALSDGETVDGTPDQASIRSVSIKSGVSTPLMRWKQDIIATPALPSAYELPKKRPMIDVGMMTEPIDQHTISEPSVLAPVAGAITGLVASVIGRSEADKVEDASEALAEVAQNITVEPLTSDVSCKSSNNSQATALAASESPEHEPVITATSPFEATVSKPAMALADIISLNMAPEATEPPPHPDLTLSGIIAQDTVPLSPMSEPRPLMAMSSSMIAQDTVPVAPKPEAQPAMALSSIVAQALEPVHIPPPVTMTEASSRKSAAASSMSGMEAVESHRPRSVATVQPPVIERSAMIAPLNFSRVRMQEIEPKDPASASVSETAGSSVIGRAFDKSSPQNNPLVSASSPKLKISFGDFGTDVLFPSKEIDARTRALEDPFTSPGGTPAYATRSDDQSNETTSDPHTRPKTPQPAFYAPKDLTPKSSPQKANTSSPRRALDAETAVVSGPIDTYRPENTGTVRKAGDMVPPLPLDHNTRIAAAAQRNPNIAQQPHVAPPGSMGPPLMPASAYKTQQDYGTARIRVSRSQSRPRGTMASFSNHGTLHRRTSSTSFASEVDQRFNTGSDIMYPDDIRRPTDPRMIAAITTIMIGQDLWKYTRKAGRSAISHHRHRRWFWVHPYMRTLYWSELAPAEAMKQQGKANSVSITAVRVIDDTNVNPPGLFQKSIVVVTPSREVVFTAPTAAQHETWVNALSYLLLREYDSDAQDPHEDGDAVDHDLAEFNPRLRSASRASGHTLSSYNSRPTDRNISPQRQAAATMIGMTPTLGRSSRASREDVSTPHRHRSLSRGDRASMSGRLSTFTDFFRPPDSLTRGRSTGTSRNRSLSPVKLNSARKGAADIYDAQPIAESDPDALKAAIAQPSDHHHSDNGLENVRACCGGKTFKKLLFRWAITNASHR